MEQKQNNQAVATAQPQMNGGLVLPADFGTYDFMGQKVALTVDLIKKQCPTATDMEVLQFGMLCQANGFNPLKREAYLVKYGTSPASSIIAKQGYMNRAESNPHYKGRQQGTIVIRQNPETKQWDTLEVEGEYVPPTWSLYGAWCRVMRDDRPDATFRVMLSEYTGEKNPLWKTKPATMLVKVAVAHGLRESFPLSQGDYGMVYYEEEYSGPAVGGQRVTAPAEDIEDEAVEAEEVHTRPDSERVDPATGELF